MEREYGMTINGIRLLLFKHTFFLSNPGLNMGKLFRPN